MILFFAGTSDARELAFQVRNAGYDLIVTVVTESAAFEYREAGIVVQVGRMDHDSIINFIKKNGVQTVIDASHPFAEEASKNAMEAAKTANIPYIRYERRTQQFEYEKIHYVNNYEEASDLAAQKRGNIMLTTGSKTLQVFTDKLLQLPDTRLIARMLPRKDNMEKCEQLGLPQKNIIAIQGPFTKMLNQALYENYEITLVVTKESGKAGSVDEKITAAMELGIEIIMILRPTLDYQTVFSTFEDVLAHLNKNEI
ncbi:precorrin-6A reductase [Bacillus solimangrovi]|uniref:Precorrin-6x reductase n=1 Tax=Bacillus solimangrovi TaxID=1305675 RepID=A0A1E5LGB0_9BACI|nr:precorrin-6A reductase [Bacillus solimangrovi]OEH93118.1 precorrin-6x reductase [Bacillus solimangrovi]